MHRTVWFSLEANVKRGRCQCDRDFFIARSLRKDGDRLDINREVEEVNHDTGNTGTEDLLARSMRGWVDHAESTRGKKCHVGRDEYGACSNACRFRTQPGRQGHCADRRRQGLLRGWRCERHGGVWRWHGGDNTIDGAIHRQRVMQRATSGKLFKMPKPTIAALPGAAAGAGLSLAWRAICV